MSDDQTHEGAIALIGMAGRFPGADTLEQFWANLSAGVCSIRFLTAAELREAGVAEHAINHPHYVPALGLRDGLELFDPLFFGISPREAEIMDPQHRLLLLCAWEALENAGYDPRAYTGAIGVFAGAMANTYFERHLQPNAAELKQVMRRQMIMANDREFLPTFISFKLDLRGPSVNVQTACSTSLVAVHYACQSLLLGECDMALAGGVALTVPARRGYYFREGMIQSPDGYCRAFDARAQGTVFGRGAGMVLLKRLEDALADRDAVQAVIRGSAVNNDGSRKLSYSAPSVDGQAEAIAAAMAIGRVEPDQIGYVEAHGTGTILGDPVEIASLTRAFAGAARPGNCAIGSVKTNLGHLDAAAGVAGLIKTVLCLRNRTLVPSLFFEQPNPRIDFANSPFQVNTTTRPWLAEGPRFAGINSFGVGGTNAHVVLEEAPMMHSEAQAEPVLLVVSALSAEVLARQCGLLADHLEARPERNLADVGYTLALGRRALPHRFAAVCGDRTTAVAALRRCQRTAVVGSAPRLIGLLPGQGVAVVGFGQALFRRGGVFADSLHRLHQAAVGEGFDLLGQLYGQASMVSTAAAQPLGFAVGMALGLQFQDWGYRFDGFLGHSLGELTAATLAGVFSLEDGLRLAIARGRLMAESAPGAMLAVAAGRDLLEPLLGPDRYIAAENAPDRTTIAGSVEAIAALADQLGQVGCVCQLLVVEHAFHSPAMAKAAASFANLVARCPRREPHTPYLSGLTATWIAPGQATDPEHWRRLILEPVRFGPALAELARSGAAFLLELGPEGGLTRFAKHLGDIVAYSAWSAANAASAALPDALVSLWQAGIAPDWTRFWAGQCRARVDLPSQPFTLRRHWVEAPKPTEVKRKTEDAGTRRHDDLSQWFYLPHWQDSPLASRTDDPRRWLVFAPRGERGERLLARLRPAVGQLWAVRPGEAFCQDDRGFFMRPGFEADHRALQVALAGLRPEVVVHAWSLDERAELSQSYWPDDLETQLDLRFYSLFHFLQQLAKSQSSCLEGTRLLILGQNTQSIASGEWAHPLGAVSHGPIRVLAQEFPGIAFTHLDLDRPAEAALAELLAEAAADEVLPLVALRDARRLRGDYRAQAIEARSPLPRLREGGVYLIVGGLGGINLEVVEYLAGQTRGCLVLTTRRAFAEPESWQALAQSSEDVELQAQLRRLLKIQALGAKVQVVQADAGDRAAMKRLLTWMDLEYGGVHGVVNAAGIVDGGMIYHRERASIEAVFWPKLHGSLLLAELLQGRELDFVVHFGTLHRAVGGVGKLAHTAASAVLDAIALVAPGHHVAIDWDAWLEVGQAAKPEAVERRSLVHPLFKALVHKGERRAYCLSLDPQRDWLLSEHRIDGKPTLPGTGYLAVIREALILEGLAHFELTDVVIQEPLTVVEGERELSVVLEGGPERGQGQVTSGAEATCHLNFSWSKLTVVPKSDAPCDRNGALPHYREPCGRQREEGFFAHGPRWHSLQWLRWSDDESVASLALAEAFQADLLLFGLHPALLDTALGLLARTHVKGTFLPFGYERVALFAPLTRSILAHARLRRGASRETIVQDVDLFDEHGHLLVAIQGFALREVGQRVKRTALEAFQLTVTPGDLASLSFRESQRNPPAAGQVELEVLAAGLNFKDVLKATGMMGRGTSAKQLGMEVSARVARLGEGVVGLEPGQRVIALTRQGLQRFVQVEAELVFPCPDNLDNYQAAGVIVAYLTAYQAFVQVGRLRAGEHVLIHCATGGVGMAALHLALRLGARVHASAGSAAKRAFLARFPLESIHDSRGSAFAAELRSLTDGRGVDLVLNSLSGEALQVGLDLLAPFGRFLELGRRDIEAGTPLSLAHFRQHLTFAAITASPAMPGFQESMAYLLTALARGDLPPLELKTFGVERSADGFALLAQAGHIGKVVIDFASHERVRAGRAPLSVKPQAKGHGMRPAEGVEVFARLLAHDYRQVVVSTRPLAGVTARQDRRLLGRGSSLSASSQSGDLIQMLSSIWAQFLGLDQVAADANFFALGGDSLTAIQIVAQINRRFGASLSSYALLDDPTIEDLARRLVTVPATPAGRLISLNEGPSGDDELYLFPPMEGDLFGYRQLAQCIGETKVWGVHEPSQTGQSVGAASLEELATRHLELILAHRTTGPFRLAGFSFGGLVALEAARQLHARGLQVTVAMIDSYGPTQLTHSFKDDVEVLAFLMASRESLQQVASRLATLDERGRADAFAAARGQTIESSALSAMLAVFRANAALMRAYRPVAPVGPVLHVAAQEPLPGFPTGAAAYWRECCGAWLREVLVPGNHLNILAARELAKVLREFFSRG